MKRPFLRLPLSHLRLQESAHILRRDGPSIGSAVVHDKAPDAVLEDEADGAGFALLVVRHGLHDPIDRHFLGNLRGKAYRPQERLDPRDVGGAAVSQALAEAGLKGQADRHALAVIEGVPGGSLQRPADRVAEIQSHAPVALVDVRGHKIAFDLAVAPCRELGQGVVADELGGAEPPLDERVLEGLEENRVGDAGVLDGLSEPLANLPIGQREPPVEVDEHRGRLVECADEIGGRWGVDRRLPSDRGVRRAQQRRRQADVRDPPSERRGHEAGEVGDDAASESLCPGAERVLVEPDRRLHPVSSARIRAEGALRHWEMMPTVVRAFMVKKVVLMGPESTGKTVLARNLAMYYNTEYVSEYKRSLLDQVGDNDTLLEDYPRIAMSQYLAVYEARTRARKVLFVDTEALVAQNYSGLYEGFHQRIIDEIARLQDYDLVLYLSPDVPWVDDGTRVFGEEREEADAGLRALLAKHGVEVVEVNGSFARRLDIAVNAVDRLLEAESAGSNGSAGAAGAMAQ